ncbi:MAG: hypothetical protein L0Z62_28710 [Gemmataceae bacterium]|nr:hypothetical protein [Gemmataceae bacterium]
MRNFVKQLGVATLAAVVTVGVAAPSAHAQFRVIRTSPVIVNPNLQVPNLQVAPGLSLSQAAFNTAVTGRAFNQVPPFLFGFNPFPPTFTPFAPVFSSRFQPGFPTGFQRGFSGFVDPRFRPGFSSGFRPGFQRGFGSGFRGRF